MKDFYFENTNLISQKQWELLQEQLQYTVSNSSFYRELFEKHKLSSGEIKTPEDFRKIPLTAKEDLQLRNVDFCAVAREEIIDFVTTSGT
ncbi:MAG: phenylacetate--CoA ligase family protein, partial [Salegentibacter sp.]